MVNSDVSPWSYAVEHSIEGVSSSRRSRWTWLIRLTEAVVEISKDFVCELRHSRMQVNTFRICLDYMNDG